MANVREVKQSIDDAGDAVSEAGSESARAVKGELHALREKLRANTAHLEEELRDASDRFVEGTRTFRAAAVEQVREHPLAAFGVAFAAGVIVTRLMRRR